MMAIFGPSSGQSLIEVQLKSDQDLIEVWPNSHQKVPSVWEPFLNINFSGTGIWLRSLFSQWHLFPTWDAIARSPIPREATSTIHFALSIRANWSTQYTWRIADIKRCARSGPDYLEPKGLPAELKELSWTESATRTGYKHTIWIQRILPANRDRALGYKTTPLKPRGENGWSQWSKFYNWSWQ